MARYRPRNSNFYYYAGTAFSVCIVIGALIYGFVIRNPRNSLTGCSEDPERTLNTFAFLIDGTDSISDVQMAKVENLIETLISATLTEDRFQIYLMTASESEILEPVFDRCSYVTSFFDSPALERFRKSDFERRLQDVLTASLEIDTSPIIHAINSVTVGLPRDQSKKHLIVVSDLYENSSILSMYSMRLSEALASNRRQLLSKIPDLRNINVYLQVIDRPTLKQDGEFIESWINLLEESGATLEKHYASPDSNHVIMEPAERITG